MVEKIEKVIAEKVKQEGGRTFYVGGYVRDFILNKKSAEALFTFLWK